MILYSGAVVNLSLHEYNTIVQIAIKRSNLDFIIDSFKLCFLNLLPGWADDKVISKIIYLGYLE